MLRFSCTWRLYSALPSCGGDEYMGIIERVEKGLVGCERAGYIIMVTHHNMPMMNIDTLYTHMTLWINHP